MLVGAFHSIVRAGPATVVFIFTSGTTGVGPPFAMTTLPVKVAVRLLPLTDHDWPVKLDAVKVTSSTVTPAGIGTTIFTSLTVTSTGTSTAGIGTLSVLFTTPPMSTGSTSSVALTFAVAVVEPTIGRPEQVASTGVGPSADATPGATSTIPEPSTMADSAAASVRRERIGSPPGVLSPCGPDRTSGRRCSRRGA